MDGIMSSSPSWHAAISTVSSRLYRAFGYTSPQDRADALQNAVLRLLSLQRTSGLYMNDEDTINWLHCVASRMLVDAYRGRTQTKVFSDAFTTSDDSSVSVHEPSVKPAQGTSELGMDIGSALYRLSPSLRLPFELHSQGFSCDEIAVVLHITRDAAHKRVQRARREMRRLLKDYL